jgi:hypothetical protein
MMMLCLTFGTQSISAQHKNDILLLQSLEELSDLSLVQMEAIFYQKWRDQGVRKMRIQPDAAIPGTYSELIEFDAKGNVAHQELPKGITRVISYDKKDNLREVASFENGKATTTQYFYYSRKGDLKNSVLKFEGTNREMVGYYNSVNLLERVSETTKGITTKTTSINYTFDDVGQLTAISMPGMSASYLYQDGKLIQFQIQEVGKKAQLQLSYGKEGLSEAKMYAFKDGDYILKTTTSLEYNNAGMIARQTTRFRDANAKPQIENHFYDVFNPATLAMRGDWDGGGYGYGTPVIVQWANPELDTRVTDSTVSIRFDLKPGVGQEMPTIKKSTLRLNHKLTKREIGNVVLQRLGETNTYFVEETLPLYEGANTVYLEVETELGKFTSGERIIMYKNPKRQIQVADLHVLAIGISDYEMDGLDVPHANKDIDAIVASLTTQQGKLFGSVKTQILTDKEATKTNIEDAIAKIKGKAAAQDLVLIYFAGQGEEWEGNFYLKPSDIKGNRSDLSKNAIDNRWVLEEISRYNAPALYFLDASQSVSGEGVEVGNANLDEVQADFEDVITNDDDIRIFMSATSSKQKAKTVEGTSYFAQALLEGLSGKADEKGNNNGTVTVDELSDYVADRVLDMTSWSQKPTSAKRGIGLVPVAKVN